MSRVGAFGRFWWDFIVGDDWVSAAGVVVGLAVTAATGQWWVLPIVVALVLTLSLARATRP
jgi:divalent metal cation (Fe/Co/Zn/Cd) transporter